MVVPCEIRTSVPSRSLLRQEANVRQYVLHFFIGELPAPRMHWTEDNAVFDCSQLVGVALAPSAIAGKWSLATKKQPTPAPACDRGGFPGGFLSKALSDTVPMLVAQI